MTFKDFCKDRDTDKRLYADAYEQEFHEIRTKRLTILEIGIFAGGSLKVLDEYFPRASVFGIDIDPGCAKFENVFIGDQRDKAFLTGVLHKIGGADIVIDDGSHITSHQQRSFEILFPLLNPGGIYAIEDLCTSYWLGHPLHFVDGLPTTEYLKNTLDLLNESGRDPHEEPFPTHVSSIRFYRSICFLRKKDSRQIGEIKEIELPPSQPPTGLLRRDHALSK